MKGWEEAEREEGGGGANSESKEATKREDRSLYKQSHC